MKHLPLQFRHLSCANPDVMALLRRFQRQYPYCAVLESVDRAHGRNDFSFVALGARDVITIRPGKSAQDPLKSFENFIGSGKEGGFLEMGYIGYLSFESARFFEEIDLVPDPETPDAEFFLPEVLLKIDHAEGQVTLIAHQDTSEDLEAISEAVAASSSDAQMLKSPSVLPTLGDIEPYRMTSRDEFVAQVRDVQEKILSGEAFQVVLSQELRLQSAVTPESVYEHLRAINPSPYMYCFQTPERTIVGASPETLLRVDGRKLLYRPIAGTRKRTGDPVTDAAMERELLSDLKERSEHQMLVDLGRNDIGRVAEIGSVTVEDAFHLERYAHVYHIVSDIHGVLKSDCTSLDALRSVFPAGTLTGAPKVRAMEIIRAAEGGPRGIYGGAFGYIDASGNIDFAITIRTMLFRDGEISLRVGAGIVKDSVPEREDNECLHKARSCLAAVKAAENALSIIAS